ncbi:MAG: ATP-dependent zinc metalloprotease FtsH [Candidatus Saccharimonadia bacterium]
MKINNRSFLFLLGALLVLAVLAVVSLGGPQPKQVSLSQLITEAKNNQIKEIDVNGQTLTIKLKDATQPQQVTYTEASATLKDYGIDYSKITVNTANPNDTTGHIIDLLLTSFLPILLIIGLFYLMMRQAQGSNNQAMTFGKSRARLFGPDKARVTFNDVAGSEEAKQELQEIVEFLKYPQKFEALGARIPKGVLLFGPPGTGKTLLARAVAGEAGVPFFSISGSEFVEMFVGVGASRVRDLFAKAKKNAPCIIFIDEIDAVGRQRGTGMGGGHDEREQTLNQILVEMDGFEQGTNVIVMAATNRADVLDPALLRPGRFDRRVTLESPDRNNRLAILEVHMKGKPVEGKVNLEDIAAKTPGFSGADLANICNEAAILAARRNLKKITMNELHEAVEKEALGPERRSHLLNDEEKALTAYHEAGHALVGHVLPNTDPVHKISIVSRGQAGGVTWSLPTEDRYMHSIDEFKDDLARSLGGRVAERLVYGASKVTTGAESDLKHASDLARKMIMDYGMGSKLSNQVFGSGARSIFLGRDLTETKDYSDATAEEIDSEVTSLLSEAAKRAEEVINKHRTALDKIAQKLVKEETIEGPDFEKLMIETLGSPKSAVATS